MTEELAGAPICLLQTGTALEGAGTFVDMDGGIIPTAHQLLGGGPPDTVDAL